MPTDVALTALCVILYLAGAGLPLAGLLRLRTALEKNIPDAARPTLESHVDDFEREGSGLDELLREIAARADAAPRLDLKRAEFDLGLVGGGIVCATAASLISLFIPS